MNLSGLIFDWIFSLILFVSIESYFNKKGFDILFRINIISNNFKYNLKSTLISIAKIIILYIFGIIILSTILALILVIITNISGIEFNDFEEKRNMIRLTLKIYYYLTYFLISQRLYSNVKKENKMYDDLKKNDFIFNLMLKSIPTYFMQKDFHEKMLSFYQKNLKKEVEESWRSLKEDNCNDLKSQYDKIVKESYDDISGTYNRAINRLKSEYNFEEYLNLSNKLYEEFLSKKS